MANQRENTFIICVVKMPQMTLSVSFVGEGADWYLWLSHAIVCGDLYLKMNSSVKVQWEYRLIHEYMEVTRCGSKDRVMAIPPSLQDRLLK